MENNGFKFQLCDLLTHKALMNMEKRPIFFVVERVRQECYGGVQNFYVCRAFQDQGASSFMNTELTRLVESELELHPDFK